MTPRGRGPSGVRGPGRRCGGDVAAPLQVAIAPGGLSAFYEFRLADGSVSRLAKETGLEQTQADGRPMGMDRGSSSWPAGTRGRSGVDTRLFGDVILWMAGNAARWRGLPEVFGRWSGVHVRFRRWSHAGVRERHVPCHGRHAGFRVRPDRRHHIAGAHRCDRRKREA